MFRFSVIIPVYNGEKNLRPCLDSVLNQTYNSFEVILVNDGSRDTSPKICDEYAAVDDRVKVIHKQNAGVTAARKDAAFAASGEYVICVDADDWIDQTCFEKISKIIDQTSADMICHGFFEDDGTNLLQRRLRERTGLYCKADIQKEIFPHLIQDDKGSYFSSSLWAKAIKRELFVNNLILDPRVKIGEDGASVIPCVFHAQSMYIMDQCLYYYRYNAASATKSKKVFSWDGPELIAKHLIDKIDMQSCDFQDQLYRKVVHELFSVVLSQFNRQEPYTIIKDNITNIIESIELYRTSIQHAQFGDSLRARIMHYALRHNACWLIAVYAHIKNMK